MTVSSPIKVGQEFEALVCFTDYSRFAVNARALGSARTAEFLQSAAELIHGLVTAAGGVVVKYIGDAALVVFPPEAVDAGVAALQVLVQQSQEHAKNAGWDTQLRAGAHFGSVVGVLLKGCEQPDILGDTVNIAATLERQSGRHGALTLSAQAFRKLGSQARKSFHRFRLPEVYISR